MREEDAQLHENGLAALLVFGMSPQLARATDYALEPVVEGLDAPWGLALLPGVICW